MTGGEQRVIVRTALPARVRGAVLGRLRGIAPDDWNRADLTDELSAVLPADRAEELARVLLDSGGVDSGGRPDPRRMARIVDQFRVDEELLAPVCGDVPGRPLTDLADLAAWLNLTMPELEWFTDEWLWLRGAAAPLRHYRVTRLAKPGGVRVIEAPKPRLREIQRRILRHVLDPAAPHPAAKGFRPGGSVHVFAAPHAGAATVLRLDLRSCFSTVTFPRVRGVFRRLGYPPAVAAALARLCTVSTPGDELAGLDPWLAATLRTRHLPQGAPTSPALANLVMTRLDARLDGLARARGLVYSRYGDDLAFSGAMDSGLIAAVAGKVAADEGFTVHPDKTRVMHRWRRQELAGVVVNERVQAPRSEYDALRALLHNAARHGAESQNHADVEDFRAHVYGRIAWVSQGSPARRERLRAMADRVRW